MYIKGRIVSIRAIEKGDLNFLKDMMNDEGIERMTVDDHFPISTLQEEQWYMNNICNPGFHKYIIDTPNDGAVGLVSLEDINWRNRSFQIPIKIMKERCGTVGVGIDAHMAMLRYAFDELQMYRAWGITLDYNQASLNMLKSCGYTVEGRNRSAIYKNGKYHDLVLTSLLREEYYKFIEREGYWD